MTKGILRFTLNYLAWGTSEETKFNNDLWGQMIFGFILN
jgi:hypothetical protein